MLSHYVLLLLCCVNSMQGIAQFDCDQFTCRHRSHKAMHGGIGLLSIGLLGFGMALYNFRKAVHFEPKLKTLNVITSRTVSNIPTGAEKLFSIDNLVEKIHKQRMPKISAVPIEKSDAYLLVEEGIAISQEDPVVFIFSRGYARSNKLGTNDNFIQQGACAMAAYIQARDRIVCNAPCIAFDYPDKRRLFNFGQTIDASCLHTVHQSILFHAPYARIVLVGDCRGARAILEFCASQPSNVHAVILMSPFISARELTASIARNHLSWLPGANTILYNFFKFWFPQYREHEDNLTERLSSIDPRLPILIGHRLQDTLVSDEQMNKLISVLKNAGNERVHFIAVQDALFPHSRITHIPEFQREVRDFLDRYVMRSLYTQES